MTRILTASAVAFTVVVGAASCGGGNGSTKTDGAGTVCRGVAKPVSVAAAREALRDAGFSVERVTVRRCRGDTRREDILAELSNENMGDRIEEEQGSVTCAIYRGPIYNGFNRDLHEPAASPIFTGRKASWWFANVECDIYPSERNPDEQVAKLNSAMETLARGIGLVGHTGSTP